MVRAEGLEPSRAYAQRIFLPATAFAAPASPGLRSGLSLHRTLHQGLGAARLVSTPSRRRVRAWLGIAISQGSPNLGSSASPVSRRALKFRSSPLRLPFRHARIFGEQMIRLDLWLCKGDRQWQPGHRGARRRHFQRPSGLVRSECLDFVGRGRMTLMVSIFFARGFSSVASFSAFLEARATLRFFRRSKATTAPGMLLH